MNFPKQEWDNRVVAAHEALHHDAHFDLDGVHVMRLLSLFGPHLSAEYRDGNLSLWNEQTPEAVAGWQCRAWNSLLCCEKVVGLCEPLDLFTDFNVVLNDAKAVVLAKEPGRVREIWRKHRLVDSDHLFYNLEEGWDTSERMEQAMFAYENIEHALGVVRSDVDAEFSLEKTEWEELDSDHWHIPTAIWVSKTLGGVYSRPDASFVDDNARREFWQWWLDESLMASWDLRDG